MLLLLVHGLAGVIATPAAQLLIHDMVETEELPSASHTGHLRHGEAIGSGVGLGEAFRILEDVRNDSRLVTLMLLGGATSFFVGNAFHAQMPEYAHHLGADEAGVRYSLLRAANASGAVLGAIIDIHWSLALSAVAVAVATALLTRHTTDLQPE